MTKKLILVIVSIILSGCGSSALFRYPPNRWLKDLDRYPIEKPKGRHAHKYWDIAHKQLFYRLEEAGNIPDKTRSFFYYAGLGTRKEALNVNNFDEVADSTWFTNRVGRYQLSSKEIARGSNQNQGPETRGPWKILTIKTEGLTPGFLIEDARGDKYFIKFDPPGYPELASGAEVISTKLFHAFGYNVPENYIVEFDRNILRVSSSTTTRDRYGRKIPFLEKDLDGIFDLCEPNKRGLHRALASKLLPGEPLGPFSLEGKRSGDTNDRISHQHRRELRGYQVFAALTNHGDSRESNSLDMFVRTDGKRGFVKHYLIDFGGTIGSAGVGPKGKNHLYDYRLNYARTLAALGLIGFYRPFWVNAESTSDPSVGFFESKLFKPQSWKPTYLNPNFRRMSPRDGFWGAKIVMKLKDEDIAAIVKEARYTHPKSADYITQRLIERRDKIGKYWFKRVNPLDEFSLSTTNSGSVLHFKDLAVDSGLESASTTLYRYRWRPLKAGKPLGPWEFTRHNKIPLSSDGLVEGKRYMLSLQTKHGDSPWSPTVGLIAEIESEIKLLGLKRRY